MSFDNSKGTNKELGATPALITPVSFRSAYMKFTQQAPIITSAAKRLSKLVKQVSSAKSLTTVEKYLIEKEGPVLLRTLGVNMESMAHAVSDPAPRSGPKQGNEIDNIIKDIELHINGYSGKALPDTELGQEIANAVGQSTDRMFNQEGSEGDGIVFDAAPESLASDTTETGMKTGVKILLGEDGLKIDFESSAANIIHSVNRYRTRYASTVASLLNQCRAGKCECRNPDCLYVGSTEEELKERLQAAVEITQLFNNGKINETFLTFAKRAFELAQQIEGKDDAGQVANVLHDLQNAIETTVDAFRFRLPYVNTKFIITGEVSEYNNVESTGTAVKAIPVSLQAQLDSFNVAVMSISFEDLLNGFYREYKKLVKEHGFDLVSVDADLPEGVASVGFVYYRFVREIICGLIEHAFDLKGMLKESV